MNLKATFDIKDATRLKIYQRMSLISGGISGLALIATPLVATLPTENRWVAFITGALAAVSGFGSWVGQLAANHVNVDAILNAVDTVPGN